MVFLKNPMEEVGYKAVVQFCIQYANWWEWWSCKQEFGKCFEMLDDLSTKKVGECVSTGRVFIQKISE